MEARVGGLRRDADGGSVDGRSCPVFGVLARSRGLRVWFALALWGCTSPQAADTDVSVRLPALVDLYDYALADAFPHRFDFPVAMVEFGEAMYVAERAGRVYSFRPHDPDAGKTLVLDLRDRTIGQSDSGLLALTVREGELYVYYAWVDVPVEVELETKQDKAFTHYLRLSRYVLEDDGRADPDSEQVLISLRDRHLYHQGGGMLFHPEDGFLYLSIGDEGASRCSLNTCQRVDESLFGGVLRIDVDEQGGDVSHPIPRQPEDGATAHYYIPNDNPFVGREDTLEEFYALGLRNPYRMTYDPVDGLVWISDVGQARREEIDILSPGANYQWNVLEGDLLLEEDGTVPDTYLGVWTDPVWTFPHETMRAIIGGYVYRGTALPSLYGAYIHAGYNSGTLYAARYALDGGQVVVHENAAFLETDPQKADEKVVSFAVDRDQELYVLRGGDDTRIQRLEARADPPREVHRRLSETGLFKDVAGLVPDPRLTEYEVSVPLWSDGADKRRFVAFPDGRHATLAAGEPPDLPPGTVLVKHFSMVMDEGDPESIRHLETRVVVVQDEGVRAATYRWRDDQQDADLLLAHAEEELELTSAEGETETATYVYPSPGECLRCHHDTAGDALGFRVAQLNRLDESAENPLRALVDLGLVDLAGAKLSDLPALVPLDDDRAGVESRVRSYLDANCSFCHGTQTLRGALWDARLQTPLDEAKIVDGPVEGAASDALQRIVRPGDPEHSLMLQRVSSTERGLRMPPLGSTRPDPTFVQELANWIERL